MDYDKLEETLTFKCLLFSQSIQEGNEIRCLGRPTIFHAR